MEENIQFGLEELRPITCSLLNQPRMVVGRIVLPVFCPDLEERAGLKNEYSVLDLKCFQMFILPWMHGDQSQFGQNRLFQDSFVSPCRVFFFFYSQRIFGDYLKGPVN